LYIRNGKT